MARRQGQGGPGQQGQQGQQTRAGEQRHPGPWRPDGPAAPIARPHLPRPAGQQGQQGQGQGQQGQGRKARASRPVRGQQPGQGNRARAMGDARPAWLRASGGAPVSWRRTSRGCATSWTRSCRALAQNGVRRARQAWAAPARRWASRKNESAEPAILERRQCAAAGARSSAPGRTADRWRNTQRGGQNGRQRPERCRPAWSRRPTRWAGRSIRRDPWPAAS